MTDTPLPLMPLPPEHSFASDNAAGVAPEVMEALVEANAGSALAYGQDRWTAEAQDAVDELMGRYVETLMCWGGTGANVVGLSSVLESHQAIVAADTAHIVVDECGAPAKFSGASVLTVPTTDGRLRPDDLEHYVHWIGVEHHPQPAVVSISQVSEMGTLYSIDDLGALCDRAHALGMLVHLDGARVANAVAALDTTLESMVVATGIDVMTLGMTKNGAMYGEAVVFCHPELARRAVYVRKQAGQLVSKNRFVAAQLVALLTDDLWLRLARRANDSAKGLADRVRDVPEVQLLREPEANSVFAVLPSDLISALRDWSFFWDWDVDASLVRWMTSWATTEADLDRFAAGIDLLAGGAGTS